MSKIKVGDKVTVNFGSLEAGARNCARDCTYGAQYIIRKVSPPMTDHDGVEGHPTA